MVITGQMDFRSVTSAARSAGRHLRIRSDVPHEAHAGPEGAVVIRCIRADPRRLGRLQTIDPVAPVWPRP